MTKTSSDNDAERGGVRKAGTADSLLFFGTLAFGLAMLALLGFLAVADVVGVAHILPFLALPPALFIASAALLWQWMSTKGKSGEQTK
jgi:uncharacterized membrane protein